MKLLIVEDGNLNMDRLHKAILKRFGEISIVTAQSCSEANKFFDKFQPDTVILDIALPDGSGINLIWRFKDKNSSVRIIVWTSYSSSEFKKPCLELGADSFFEKWNIRSMINHIYNTMQGIPHQNMSKEIIQSINLMTLTMKKIITSLLYTLAGVMVTLAVNAQTWDEQDVGFQIPGSDPFKISTVDTNTTIDISSYTPGLYFIETGKARLKFMKI